MVGTMASNSPLCRSILVSIANPRVFHLAIHTGLGTEKEYSLHTFPRSILRQLASSDTIIWWEHVCLPPTGGSTRSTDGEFPKNFSLCFGAHRDSICGSTTASSAGPLTSSAPASTRAAHVAALTHRHPLPPIMEGDFLKYTDALANLPEEPTTITLPAFGAYPLPGP